MTLTLEMARDRGKGRLPGLIGIEFTHLEHGRVRARLPIREELLAPNGYLHAATVVALADTCCGYGALASLPQSATGFTTIELKTNFTGTALEGVIECTARLAHGGRSTQVWDAEVSDPERGRSIALFRCTQFIMSGQS
ncbi:MAG: PaaI family thioesterase [Phycisphaeraceae bacterium]